MSDHHQHQQHQGHDHDHDLSAHSEADLHGMLVVGEAAVFLSHLPMFGHAHHDIQAILEVHLTNDGSDPQAAYVNDRRTTGERVYTLEPEHFFLPLLVTPEPGQECLCEFTGMLHRGHFERGGTALPPDVTVNVDHVVHFRQFDPQAAPLAELTYILFGTGEERFLAHLITRPPDFDQVVSVRIAKGKFTDDELRRGPIVTVPGRANSIDQRLKAGEEVKAVVEGTTTEIELEVGTELYFEEGELGETFSQAPTPEEQAAGF